jgi:hypothetical protein
MLTGSRIEIAAVEGLSAGKRGWTALLQSKYSVESSAGRP